MSRTMGSKNRKTFIPPKEEVVKGIIYCMQTYNKSICTVMKWRRTYGLVCKKKTRAISLPDKEQFTKDCARMNIDRLANKYNISRSTATTWLGIFDIDVLREKQEVREDKRLESVLKQWSHYKPALEVMTDSQLCRAFGIIQSQLMGVRRALGVDTKNKNTHWHPNWVPTAAAFGGKIRLKKNKARCRK